MPPRLPRACGLPQWAPSPQHFTPRGAFFSSTARAAQSDSSRSSSSTFPSRPAPVRAATTAFPTRPPPPPPSLAEQTLTTSLLGLGGKPGGGAEVAAKANRQAGEMAARMLNRYRRSHEFLVHDKQKQLDILRNQKNSQDFLRQMPRRFKAGDLYSPHDMSPVEMAKWKKRSSRNGDVVDALGIRPLDMYKNFSLVQDFTNSSGQIIHSRSTSLRPVNQRKIAKMIRRVQGMGIYPSIHDHPEMIRYDFFPHPRDA